MIRDPVDDEAAGAVAAVGGQQRAQLEVGERQQPAIFQRLATQQAGLGAATGLGEAGGAATCQMSCGLLFSTAIWSNMVLVSFGFEGAICGTMEIAVPQARSTSRVRGMPGR